MALITGTGCCVAQSSKSNQPYILFKFTPLETFEVESNGNLSIYTKGLNYSVVSDNLVLQDLAKQWLLDSKIERIK